MSRATQWLGDAGATGMHMAAASLAELAGLYWAAFGENGRLLMGRAPVGPGPCGGVSSCSLRSAAADCSGAAKPALDSPLGGASVLVVCRGRPGGHPPAAAASRLAEALAVGARLEAETDRTVRELAATYHELAMAYRTLEGTGVAESRETMAERVLERAAQAVAAEGGAFVATQEQGGMLPLAVRGLVPAEVPELWDAATGNLHVADGQGLPFSFHLGARHYLACPVQHGGRRVGMIALYRSGLTPFTSREGKLLKATGRQAALALRNRDLVDDLRSLFLSTVQALMAAVEAKDPYTCGHSRRVADMARQTAVAMGLDAELVEQVHIAAVVHDVGKIGVDTDILRKPGTLSETEWGLVREHPDRGAGIIGCVPQLQGLVGAVRHHHERLDGEGYPSGLAGDDIPLGARIIAVCDAYDAMTSARPYRAARTPQEAVRELLGCEGRQFDPEATEHFLKTTAA